MEVHKMEIITEINTSELFKIMKDNLKGTNTKTFCEDLENSYYLFDLVIKNLINIEYDLTYLLNDIHTREVFIGDEQDKNELSENNFHFYKLDNEKYLIIEK